MKHNLTIECSTEELVTISQYLAGYVAGTPGPAKTEAPVEEPAAAEKPKRKSRAKPKKAEPEVVEPEVVDEDDDEDLGLDDEAPTLDDVKTAVKARIERDGGTDGVKEVFAGVKAKKISDVSEADYAKVIKALA